MSSSCNDGAVPKARYSEKSHVRPHLAVGLTTDRLDNAERPRLVLEAAPILLQIVVATESSTPASMSMPQMISLHFGSSEIDRDRLCFADMDL